MAAGSIHRGLQPSARTTAVPATTLAAFAAIDHAIGFDHPAVRVGAGFVGHGVSELGASMGAVMNW